MIADVPRRRRAQPPAADRAGLLIFFWIAALPAPLPLREVTGRAGGTMSLTFPSYLALSVAAAAAVFGHATYMHRYLYRTVVHLASSKVATLVRFARGRGLRGGGGGEVDA